MNASQRERFVKRWLDSYERYRYRRLIHAVRLGLAVLFATLLAKLLHLQHGEWLGMTVFVVLGMLQFQGAIYSKAVERMLGTVIGLAPPAQQQVGRRSAKTATSPCLPD